MKNFSDTPNSLKLNSRKGFVPIAILYWGAAIAIVLFTASVSWKILQIPPSLSSLFLLVVIALLIVFIYNYFRKGKK